MRKELKLPTILIYIFLAILILYFASKANYEFTGYALVAGLAYYFVLYLDKKYNFPTISIWLFAIWITAHMLCGAIYINGTWLYNIILWPFYDGGGEFVILKCDQLVHAYCFFAVAILIYYALKHNFKKDSKVAITVFAILATIGISLLNEVIEFGMVIFADAGNMVGGYYNTGLDMVFNLIGAVLGATFAKDVLDKKK